MSFPNWYTTWWSIQLTEMYVTTCILLCSSWIANIVVDPVCFDYFKPTTQTYTSNKVTPPSNESTTPWVQSLCFWKSILLCMMSSLKEDYPFYNDFHRSLTVTDKEMTTTLAIALPLVCVAVLFGIVVFLIYRRKRKNGESSTG